MGNTFCVSRDTATDFMRLFVNRLAYGYARWEPLPNGHLPYFLAQKRPSKELIPLDPGVVRMHLNGDITINLFAVNPKTQRSKWIAIDADFTGAIKALFRLRRELKKDGVESALEPSNRGGHLWIFAETPLLASECRIYIYNLALRADVPIMRGPNPGIEVFPKQDRIESGEFGNALRAPLGIHRKTNLRYWFYDADTNPQAQLAFLNQVKKLPEDKLKSLIQGLSFPEEHLPRKSTPYVPRPAAGDREEFQILKFVTINNRVRDSRNWVAPCPACRDAGGDKSGDNLKIDKQNPRKYKCWKGCDKYQIRAALGQPVRYSKNAQWR
jgi:hypothetical protein